MRMMRRLGACMCFVVAIGGFAALSVKAPAQAAAGQQKPGAQTVEALLVSDIHFEPFWDPGKVAELAAAPASRWKAILDAPASPDREQEFAACNRRATRAASTPPHTLFESSLRAMRADAAGAKFVIVSGDLMAHSASCKFTTLLPKAAPGDYRIFAEKTLDYVMSELRRAMPGVPVYAALGNNDSGCGDYQMDANSDFLETMGKTFAADLAAAERKEALRTFAAGGYYRSRCRRRSSARRCWC